MIAGSHWEVLGWGSGEHVDTSEDWVVTYFAKTLFTPAGIDLYSRRKEGLSEETTNAVRKALQGMEYKDLTKLAGEIFEVERD